MSAGHTLAWVVGIAVVVGASWTWGCREAGDVAPRRTPVVLFENCSMPTRRADGSGRSTPTPATGQTGRSVRAGDAPAPGRRVFMVATLAPSAGPGRATTVSTGGDRYNEGRPLLTTGQRVRTFPRGALATLTGPWGCTRGSADRHPSDTPPLRVPGRPGLRPIAAFIGGLHDGARLLWRVAAVVFLAVTVAVVALDAVGVELPDLTEPRPVHIDTGQPMAPSPETPTPSSDPSKSCCWASTLGE